jgi:hypothetical protein
MHHVSYTHRRGIALVLGLGYALSVASGAVAEGTWSQKGSFILGDSAGDNFGISLSVDSDGDTVAIGAWKDAGNAPSVDAGHVRIFEHSSGTWSPLGTALEGEAASDYFGSAVSISDAGTRVAVGSPYNDVAGAGVDAGHVQVWELSGGSWTQMGVSIDGENAGEQSGFALALSGDGTTVAIGSPYTDVDGTDRGSVRVFTWNGGTSAWDRKGTVDLKGEANQDRLGYAVAINGEGTIVAAGARQNDRTGVVDAGHVRTYQWNAGTSEWDQWGSDINGEAAGDYFGSAVSLSSAGTILAVGAPRNSVGLSATNAGHFRVFAWDNAAGDWAQQGIDTDGAVGEKLGTSLELSSSGTRVLAGAPDNGSGGSSAGAARLYEYSAGVWSALATDYLGGAGDEAGTSVSLSGDGTTASIGYPFNDDGGADAGGARIFTYSVTVEQTPASTGTPGIYLHVAGPVGRSVAGSPVYYGSDRVAVTSTYLLRIYSSTGITEYVLAEGTVDARGNLEASIALPPLVEGDYDVTFSGTHSGGHSLHLSSRVSVDDRGHYTAIDANVSHITG